MSAIFLAPSGGAPMRSVSEVQARAGRGLEGDRYALEKGTYSGSPEPSRQVTLIELEAVEAVRREAGIRLEAGETRRNLVTRGVSLNELVGREFQVGEARLRGVELCEPCARLVRLSGKDVLRPLVHRGGLNAEILRGGTIRVGDQVEQYGGHE